MTAQRIRLSLERFVGKTVAEKLAGPVFFAFAIKVTSAALSYLMLVAFALVCPYLFIHMVVVKKL